ncbi:MAG: diguanylate cyclase [Proteobacteria bacterium]|nr:diguanylate cyclase [Pseudomonadota bacterium]
MKILVVDDEPFMRIVIQDCLANNGFNDVVTASSADHSFEMLGIMEASLANEPLSVDCILMDIAMPGTDGVEACRRIKNHEDFRDIPIIMVTSMKDDKIVKKAFAAGAAEYVAKPINEVELITRLNTVLDFKQKIDEYKAKEKKAEELNEELETSNKVLKQSNERLIKLSHLDEVTGLANTLHFEKQFFIEWRRAIRNKLPISLILLNIDFLEDFMEEHGQELGEDCLEKVASELSAGLNRPTDLVVRFGEIQFAVLLPDTDLEGGLNVANSLRKAIKELRFENSKSKISDYITASLGLSTTFPTDDVRPTELLGAAKKSLLIAEEYGGNQVKGALLEF